MQISSISCYSNFTFSETIAKFVLFTYTLIYAETISYERQTTRTLVSEPCQFQILGFEGEFCITETSSGDNITYSDGRTFNTTFEDTNGVITLFKWTNEVYTPLDGSNNSGKPKVRALEYTPLDSSSSDCKPMQFTVYNSQGYASAVEYFTLGKGPSWCMIFLDDNSTFTTYNTVSMLAPDALEGTDVIGDGDEAGYYIVPVCPWAYGCPDINWDFILDHLK